MKKILIIGCDNNFLVFPPNCQTAKTATCRFNGPLTFSEIKTTSGGVGGLAGVLLSLFRIKICFKNIHV